MPFTELDDTVLYRTQKTVDDASDRLITAFETAGFTVFLNLDQKAAANKVNLDLTDTRVLMVGIPEKGTLLMNKHPTMKYELPIKIVITQDENQETIALHNNFVFIQKKHQIDTPLFPNLSALIIKAFE